MLLVFHMLASQGIVVCVSIFLKGLFSIGLLVCSLGPTRVLGSGGGREVPFPFLWHDHRDGLFHGVSDEFVLIQSV